MKIQCDVCERNPATVVCCADEAALCANCDVEVHAANKLASKHQRLQLQSLSPKLPSCDICQDKAAFIFCIEDRALFCQDCDESIHVASSLAANHQRYLATGIKVALGSKCTKISSSIGGEGEGEGEGPPSGESEVVEAVKVAAAQVQHLPPKITSPGWAVDDLLELSELESTGKKGGVEIGEMDWWNDMTLFGEQTLAPAEVPELPISHLHTTNNNNNNDDDDDDNCYGYHYHNHHQLMRSNNKANKKPRLMVQYDDNDDEFCLVPDLG